MKVKAKNIAIAGVIIIVFAVGFFVGSSWGTKNTVKITRMVQAEPAISSVATIGLSAEITSALDKYYKPRRGMPVSDGEAEAWWKVRNIKMDPPGIQALEKMLQEIVRLQETKESLYKDLGILGKIEHREHRGTWSWRLGK